MSDAPTDSLPLPLTQLFLTSCQGTYIRTQLNKCQSIIYLLYDQFVHTRERKMWPEIAQGKSENRRELKLAGAEISERISASGLDSDLFALDTLNLLNISDTILQHLPAEISNLTNLQTLLLYGNAIETVPDVIAALQKLKVLDISRNKLESIPDGIADLSSLMTLNLSNNALTQFPSLKICGKLTVIDLSGNKLKEFPDICYDNNCHLAEINFKNNAIEKIPHDIVLLASLKHLNLVNNKIKKIPKSLADISKLKGTLK